MPARGRRRPRTYKSAEYYTNRITTSHPYQERLKTQLLEMFSHGQEEQVLLTRIQTDINDGLLVSREAVSNSNVYKHLRDALKSRSIRVPAVVIDKTAGAFIAKRIIAAI